ncbi:MAG: endonuclease/exonuclease/phosphatase family protein, partial [Acidimicrobiales bacterium]
VPGGAGAPVGSLPMPSRRLLRRRPGNPTAGFSPSAVAGWALVAPPVVVTTARVTRVDRWGPVLMAEALGPLIGAPALVALGLAAVTRRWRLAAVAAVTAGGHLAWLAADLRRAAPAAAGHPDSADDRTSPRSRFRLFSANVLFTNTYLDGIAAEIHKADPDVVVLQEVSAPTVAGLDRAGILDLFPHRWLAPRPDPLGTAILSRLPLEAADSWKVDGVTLANRATVVVGDHRVRLYNVHTRAPFGPSGLAIWTAQLEALGDVVRSEPGPLVLVGDFNAACGHRPFRSLLAAGVRDAHLARRRWWVTTWPSDMRLAPPFARIDHVLVSPHVVVLDVGEGVGEGSDHRPVFADLAVVGR